MAKTLPFMSASISGDNELAKLFDELPKTLTDNVLRASGKKALQPVVTDAIATVSAQSRDSGDLAKHIIISTRLSKRQAARYKQKGAVVVSAGPTYPEAAHAHLIEFGTTDRFHKSGKAVGRTNPEPFLRPAWDANKDKVLEIMRTEVWTVLKKAVARLRINAERGKMSASAYKKFISA